MTKPKFPFLSVIIGAALTIAGGVFFTVDKSSLSDKLIYSIDLTAINALFAAVSAVACVLGIALLGWRLSVFYVRRHNWLVTTRPATDYSRANRQGKSSKRSNPADFTAAFEAYAKSRPRLAERMKKVCALISEYQKKQSKIRKLAEYNDAQRLMDGTVTTIDTAWLTVQSALRRIESKVLLWEPAEAGLPEKQGVYAKYQSSIDDDISSITRTLSAIDNLLFAASEYLDEKRSNGEDTSAVESMRIALEQARSAFGETRDTGELSL